jgi:hypothetical protein
MKAKIRGGLLVVKLPLMDTPKESKSGKTLLVASSQGPRRTAARFDDKPLIVNVTAYVRPDGYVRKVEILGKKRAGTVRRVRRPKPKAHLPFVPRHKR